MALITLNNNSLTNITSLPAGVGGSMVLLETITVTSVASITVGASNIDSTYDHYQIVGYDLRPETDGAHGRMRFTIGGTEQSGASDYSKVDFRMYSGAASGGFYVNDGNASYVEHAFGESIGNDATSRNSFVMNLFNPANTSDHTYGFSNVVGNDLTPNMSHRFTGYKLHQIGAVDGVNLFWSSGNFAAEGKIKLYGVK